MNETLEIRIHTETQAAYSIRQETRGGREYMVVPVIMMVEGVHNGSGGPILHLQTNFSANPEQWNGVPLTAGHPVAEGGYVSVNQVDPDQWVVGYLENAHVADGKLRANAWIDRQRAIAVNPEIVNYLNEGKALDVSTGAQTKEIAQSGQWNGEEYQAITQSYQPDHLALLPGDRGACSWTDGCGIRNNKQEDNDAMNEQKKEIMNSIEIHDGMQNNEVGYGEISSRVQTLLDRRDSNAVMNFLREVYDDYFVYEVRDQDRGTRTYYKQTYAFDEDGDQINLEGSPQEVRQDVKYVPIQRNEADDEETSNNGGCGCSMKRTKFNTNKNKKENSDMSDSKNTQPSGEVMEKVVSLVNNERTRFTKADREWLLQMNEAQLDKFEPTEAPKAEVTREDALSVLSEDLSDTDKLLNIVADDIKDQIQNGITAYADERQKLIKSIQANTGDIWKKEKLEAMDTETLQGLEKSSRKTDYSGQAPINNNSQGSEEEEMLLPAGVTIES